MFTEKDRWKQIFTAKQDCDFCQKKNRQIMRVIVHPMFKMIEDKIQVIGVGLAKKCKKCCQEDS